MSSAEAAPSSNEDVKEASEEAVPEDEKPAEAAVQATEIIRYSMSTLLSMRTSKLSQGKPACKNFDLSCMAHHKPPPKMLIANMMPKFALNQMQNRGEESISPLSFHSNSSSSSNLSYQKRYQDTSRDGRDARDARDGRDGRDDGGYGGSRYYYNKYNKYDDNGGSSRIIYKTTGASANANGNSNNIRFLKKAYNNKYESQESSSVGLLSNKNILENSSRVITGADLRANRKIDLSQDDDKKEDKRDEEKKSPSDEKNNNDKSKSEDSKAAEVNANELRKGAQNDLKNLPDEITNHLDDMFGNMNMSQLLPEKITDERESSRFSKWFNVNKDEGKVEKTPDLQNNNNDGTMTFPQSVESEKYFQPIDKVESNSLFQLLKGQPESQSEDNPLMHMIQQQQQKSPNSGQVHSVEELEARLRQHKAIDEQQNDRKNIENEQKVLQNFFRTNLMHQAPIPQNQEDVNAFKKLLSQIANDDNKMPAQMTPNGQNLLQHMMTHGNEIMMQKQQKGFPGGQKLPGKMMNPIGSPNPVAPHMMPQQQQFGNTDMIKFMTRPEVQSIVQDLTSGDISPYTLWQRLATPNLSPIERDIITSALNIFNANNNSNSSMFPKQMQPMGGNSMFPQQMNPNALAAPIPMPQGSPLSPVPPPMDQHLLFQHQAAAAAAKQLRLSPLPAGGVPQRIPSPRELQYHTQSIMQNALIRKKLEEQRENFRKRQEQEQKEQMQKQGKDMDGVTSPAQSPEELPKGVGPLDSPIKKAPAQHQVLRQHTSSPNIFTPTSVLRKMTAEKEGDGKIDKKKAITGGQQRMQQQQQQQQPFMGGNMNQIDRMMAMQAQNDAFGKVNWDAQSPIKPPGENFQQFASHPYSPLPSVGRPIVKGAGSMPSQPSSMMSAQNQPMMSGNFDFQQQQMQKINMQKQFLQQQNQPMMQMKNHHAMDNPVLSQFISQQQMRAQQQEQMLRNQQFPRQMNFQQQMMQGRPKEQDEMENRNMSNNGGCLSPTSNQLAKWFSPELLADASAGKLPSMKMNGAINLEDFESRMQNS